MFPFDDVFMTTSVLNIAHLCSSLCSHSENDLNDSLEWQHATVAIQKQNLGIDIISDGIV